MINDIHCPFLCSFALLAFLVRRYQMCVVLLESFGELGSSRYCKILQIDTSVARVARYADLEAFKSWYTITRSWIVHQAPHGVRPNVVRYEVV